MYQAEALGFRNADAMLQLQFDIHGQLKQPAAWEIDLLLLAATT